MDISPNHAGQWTSFGLADEILLHRSLHAGIVPCGPASIPAGFHLFQVPSADPSPPTVLRNWARRRSSRRAHVLVVDENEELRMILGQLLDDEGYDVTLAGEPLNGDQIARMCTNVIVADATFIKDHEGTLADLPVDRYGQRIPVIYSTVLPRVADHLSDEGMPVLLKPFDLEEFLELLTRVSS